MVAEDVDDDDASETQWWNQTDVEREHNWYNVSGLLHGRTYRLRVAAVDPHGDMMKSEYVEIVVGVYPGTCPPPHGLYTVASKCDKRRASRKLLILGSSMLCLWTSNFIFVFFLPVCGQNRLQPRVRVKLKPGTINDLIRKN